MPFLQSNDRLFSVLFAILILFAISFSATSADQSPQPAVVALLQTCKTASGGSAWDTVESLTTTATISQGGLRGNDLSVQNVVSGLYVDHFTLGGVTGASGFDGSRNWSADDAGIARFDDSDYATRSSQTDRYIVALAFWYPNRRSGSFGPLTKATDGSHTYDVITITPDGGFPIDLWFDTDSHLLSKTVEQENGRKVTTVLSDYRTVDGVLLPYKTEVSTGDSKDTLIALTKTVVANAPTDGQTFSPQSPSVLDYSFPAGQRSTSVPFTYRLGHIFVPVKIDGRGPFDAILDSGGQLAVTPQFAHDNHIAVEGRFSGSGTGPNEVMERIARLSELQIGDVIIHDPVALTLPMPTPAENPLIGAEIFKRFAVHIDFDTLELTLTPLDKFTYSGSGSIVPFQFQGEIPICQGIVDGVMGKFMIDTGSGNSLILFPAFIQDQNLTKKYRPAFTTNSGFGVGGSQTAGVTRVGLFSLGGATTDGIITYLSNALSGSFADPSLAGNVGMGFLRRFNLTFDYRHQLVAFEPNQHFAEPDTYERMGISFDTTANGCEISSVVPGSPAAKGGVVVGDVIKSVNGVRLGADGEERLYDQMFLPAGTSVQLVVQRGRKTVSISVTLDDLL